MESLIFLNANIDNYIKRQMVYNRNPTIEWISREDAAIITTSLESIKLKKQFDVKEECDVMTSDFPNAFINTDIPKAKKKGSTWGYENYRSSSRTDSENGTIIILTLGCI